MRIHARAATCIVFVLLTAGVSEMMAAPQAPETVGIVTYANRAKSPAAALTTGATLFAGDLIETEADGEAQLQAGSLRLTIFGDGSMRLFPSASGIIVELERGTLEYSAPAALPLLVYVLDLRIRPQALPGAAGQITIVNRCDVRVISHHGEIEVVGGKKGKEKESSIVHDGTSESFLSLRAVDYRDAWKPIPADYPNIDPNSEYHRSHSHAACPAAAPLQKGAPLPGGTGALAKAGEITLLCAVVCPVVWKALESPDAPGTKLP